MAKVCAYEAELELASYPLVILNCSIWGTVHQGQNSGGCSFFYYNSKKPSWFILNWQIHEYDKENMTNTVVEIKCTSFILKILKWMHANFILAITLVFSRYLTLLNYSTEKIMKKTLKSYMAFAN